MRYSNFPNEIKTHHNKYLNPFCLFPASSSSSSSLLFSFTKCCLNTKDIPIANPFVAIQIAYEFRYVGPHAVGHIYDPAMFPSCENALMKAMATARLEGGRGMELLIQA